MGEGQQVHPSIPTLITHDQVVLHHVNCPYTVQVPIVVTITQEKAGKARKGNTWTSFLVVKFVYCLRDQSWKLWCLPVRVLQESKFSCIVEVADLCRAEVHMNWVVKLHTVVLLEEASSVEDTVALCLSIYSDFQAASWCIMVVHMPVADPEVKAHNLIPPNVEAKYKLGPKLFVLLSPATADTPEISSAVVPEKEGFSTPSECPSNADPDFGKLCDTLTTLAHCATNAFVVSKRRKVSQ